LHSHEDLEAPPGDTHVSEERGITMPILWRVSGRNADAFEAHSLGARPDCLHAEKDFVVFAASRAPEIVKRLCCPEVISEEALSGLAREAAARAARNRFHEDGGKSPTT
jgi:hypothetical protein